MDIRVRSVDLLPCLEWISQLKKPKLKPQVDQAIRFEKEVAPCTFLLYFEVSDQTLIKRLLDRGKTSGRVDDNEETIKRRLMTFHQHSNPILTHYGSKVKKIDGERSAHEIFAEVCKHIDANV